jgi:branched-chain amino acid transport system substrate-binding protein
MNMKLRTAIIVAAASLFAAPAWAKEVVVVQVAAFTGAQAQSGKAIRAGIRLYLNHVNDAGLLGADRVKFLSYDDAYKADETVRLVKESIAKDGPMAFVGVLGTANNEAILKDGVLGKANIPLIGAISGASSLINAPNMFVTKASYRDEVRRLFELISGIGLNRVAVVYQDDGFGKDILTGAEIAAPKVKINLVAKAPYERNTTKVESAVKEVLKADPQVVYLGAVTSAAVEFIKQYRKGGGGAQIYGVSVVDVDSLKKGLGGDLTAGYGFGVLWPLTTARGFGIIREYQKLLAAAPKDPDIAERSMEGYIAAKVLVHGLRQTRASPAALAKAVHGMKSVDLGDFFVDFTQNDRTGAQFVEFAILDKEGRIQR